MLGTVLPTRLDSSIVDAFAYSRVTSEHFYSPRFGPRVFRGGGLPTARLPREMISLCWDASPSLVDAVGRLALSAGSCINRRHVGTSIHTKTHRSHPLSHASVDEDAKMTLQVLDERLRTYLLVVQVSTIVIANLQYLVRISKVNAGRGVCWDTSVYKSPEIRNCRLLVRSNHEGV